MMIKQSIIRPYITEKTMGLAQKGWFSFVVFPSAKKAQIAKDIAALYAVSVTSVRTTIMEGKTKRTGKKQYQKHLLPWKKAMVRLKKGQSIDAFQLPEQEKK